jgi:hypothetical protein
VAKAELLLRGQGEALPLSHNTRQACTTYLQGKHKLNSENFTIKAIRLGLKMELGRYF